MRQSHVRQNFVFCGTVGAQEEWSCAFWVFGTRGRGVSQLWTIADEGGVADIISELSMNTTLVQDPNLQGT